MSATNTATSTTTTCNTLGPVCYSGYDPSGACASSYRVTERGTQAMPCLRQGRQSFKTQGLCSIWGYVKDCCLAPMRSLVYYASSAKFKAKLDPARLADSRNVLESAGGEAVVLETYDHKQIDCMFFSAKEFKKAVEKDGGGRFDLVQDRCGIHPVIYSHSSKVSTLLDRMGAEFDSTVATRSTMPIPFASAEEEASCRLDKKQPSVVILTQGNGGIYEFDRRKIFETLMTGNDCMVFNIRGTGRSTGVPSEQGTYTDIETVYQYLVHEKGYLNSQITVQGYCLGSGAATQLAKSHRGVNLTLDRAFARVSNMFSEVAVERVFPQNSEKWYVRLAKRVCRSSISCIVNTCILGYDNLSRIKHVKGKICILDASNDNTIPEGDALALRERAKEKEKCDVTFENGEHCGDWDNKTLVKYSSHLRKTRSLGCYGISPPSSLTYRVVEGSDRKLEKLSKSGQGSVSNNQSQ